ncbi:hypothetical protein V6Z11_A08G251200 [Gossypium hirsutum]
MTNSCKHFTQPFHITISSDTYYLNIDCSIDILAFLFLDLIYLRHDVIVSFNYGFTRFLSCCHGIFQPLSYSFSRHVAMVSFNHGLIHFISRCHGIFQPKSRCHGIFQPWSYTFHIREHIPANLILTVGLPVQAKSPVI